MARTHLARAITKTEGQSKYDQCVKELLANKQVLARILKYTVEEFKNSDIDTIMECIEGKPEISVHPVCPENPSKEKITGMNTESNSVDEGVRAFDIRFYAFVPGKEKIKIIINIEAQKDYYAGYCYETRGIFYCARMISEQLDTEFTGDNYGDLKKVYSIWICMETPEVYENTISSYFVEKEDLYGEFKGEERYDLLSVILIRLSKKENEDKENVLLRMLNVLLSHKMDANMKQQRLAIEFDMKMENEEKGLVNAVCNLSEIIVEETTEKVTKQGIINSVEKVMTNLKVSLERACEILEIDVEDYYKAKEYLSQ